MRWDGDRTVSYEARRVAWPSLDELETYPQVNGGKIDYDALSRLKESGSLEYVGEPPDPHDLVRVYATFRAASGEEETAVLCTHMIDVESPGHTPAGTEGSVKTYAILKALADDVVGYPLTIPAGTVATAKARSICEEHGLAVDGTGSKYATSSDHTFEASDDYLTVVNWLLDAAGYGSASVSAMGTVAFEPYIDPSSRPVSMSFAAGEGSILGTEVEVESDWAGAPNTVRLYYSDDSCALLATAENADPRSSASTASRKRRVTLAESVTELSGETAAQKLAGLKAAAESKLRDNAAEIEYCTFEHPFCGFFPGEAVEVVPVGFSGSVTSMELSLDAATSCKTKARRFLRRDLEIEVEGEVLWP